MLFFGEKGFNCIFPHALHEKKSCEGRVDTMPIRHQLPSLNALLVLEAAARHRSFTAAAAELHVTQAAISRQIAALEEELEAPLFLRKHRAVEPTPACLQLASTLSLCFAQMADGVDSVRATQQEATVTIGATLAFSTFWLLPRLGAFRERHPNAQIRVVSQDSRIRLHAGDVDLVVRFGLPPFDDGEVVASCADQVFPVCAPDYAARWGHGDAVLRQRLGDLIGQDVPDRSWFTWQDWFERAGLPATRIQPRLRCSHYAEALQAARAGHGIALGWGELVRQQIEDGVLVRLGEQAVEAEGRYNVLLPWRRQPHPLRDTLVTWLSESLGQP